MQGNTIHTVSEAEKNAFTENTNNILKADPDLKHRMPINPNDLFEQMQDGIVLCKLINQAVPGKVPPIAPQAICLNPVNIYHKLENLNLAIQSSKSIGCTVVNVRPEFIMEKRGHIILGLIWQVIKIHLSNQITLKRHPQIMLLKKKDEQDDVMHKMHYEQILLRWLNWHIKKNKGDRQVTNFGKDLQDSYAYGHVMHNISQSFHQKFWDMNSKQRSEQVIQLCEKEHILTATKSQDIESGNQRLNILLCAAIFNQKHGLKKQQEKVPQPLPLPQPVPQPQPEPQTDETRQMRVYKNWINAMGIDDVYVNYLIDDLKDGRILLRVIDRLRPGSVDWDKRYSNKLHSRIHIVQNCNYVIEICKQKLNVKIVQIGGVDIVDGKVTLTLGLVWQLCKLYWEERVGQISEQQLVAWGNQRVANQCRIKSLRDKSLNNCKFFLKLLESIEPKAVDFNRVNSDNSEEAIISRSNYTISIARKLGAEVMMLWEHLKEVNGKFIYTFMAELHRLSKQYKSPK